MHETQRKPIFLSHNAACLSPDELSEIRVGRVEELSRCTSAIVDGRQNVLVYGERGIGKTFFIRLLERELGLSGAPIFPVIANMSGLIQYSRGGSDAFPRAVLLQICSSIWTDLANRGYLDLRDVLGDSGNEIRFRSHAEQTIQRIYCHLMRNEIQSIRESDAQIGFSAAITGKKSNRATDEFQQSSILPFEFLEFANILLSEVLPEYGKSRIVALCDEANLLPFYKQEEILDRYLELFATKQIQFVFVAGHWQWEPVPSLPSGFDSCVEITALTERYAVELMNKYAQKVGLSLPAASARMLYDAFLGHPRYLLGCLQEACARLSPDASSISEELIEVAAGVYRSALAREQRMLQDADRLGS